MKPYEFKAELVAIVANSKGERIRVTPGVDGEDHTSITGLFLPIGEEADTLPDGDAFQLNFRKNDTKKMHIYKKLETIAKLEDSSDEEDKAIGAFPKINAHMVRGGCPLYFVHTMKDGIPVITKFSANHKVEVKRGQPQFGNKIVRYWHGNITPEEVFDDAIAEIQTNGMFVTALSAQDMLDDIKSEPVRQMMADAIEKHEQRAQAAKATVTAPEKEKEPEAEEV